MQQANQLLTSIDGLYGRKEGLEPRQDRLYITQKGLLPVESFTLSQRSYAFDF